MVLWLRRHVTVACAGPDCVGTGVGQERAVPVGIPFLLCLFSCIFTWWNNNVTLHYWNSPINTPRLTGATHHVIFSISPRRFNSDPSSQMKAFESGMPQEVTLRKSFVCSPAKTQPQSTPKRHRKTAHLFLTQG